MFDVLDDLGHRQRARRAHPLPQLVHFRLAQEDVVVAPVRGEEPLVETFGEHEWTVVFAVQEEAHRLGLRRNRADGACDVVRQRIDEVPGHLLRFRRTSSWMTSRRIG